MFACDEAVAVAKTRYRIERSLVHIHFGLTGSRMRLHVDRFGLRDEGHDEAMSGNQASVVVADRARNLDHRKRLVSAAADERDA